MYIKLGGLIGTLIASIHLAFFIITIFLGNDIVDIVLVFLNVLIYAILTIGIYKKKMISAVILFLYYIAGREWDMWLSGESLINAILPAIFSFFLLISIFGFYKENKKAHNQVMHWKFWS